MINNGLLIMAVGMGVVFSFLTIIYGVVLFYTKMVRMAHAKLGIDEFGSSKIKGKGGASQLPIEVISAAVSYYYQKK